FVCAPRIDSAGPAVLARHRLSLASQHQRASTSALVSPASAELGTPPSRRVGDTSAPISSESRFPSYPEHPEDRSLPLDARGRISARLHGPNPPKCGKNRKIVNNCGKLSGWAGRKNDAPTSRTPGLRPPHTAGARPVPHP